MPNEVFSNNEKLDVKAPLEALDWQKVGGMMPTVVQDHLTGRVLMVAMMSEESLEKTLKSGLVTFFSRSRQRLWTKGETSGHYLHLKDIRTDCDGDSLLVSALALGPTCHHGTESCFDRRAEQPQKERPSVDILNKIWSTIEARSREEAPLGSSNTDSVASAAGDQTPVKVSYTRTLLAEGVSRCAQKVGEEGVEVALAGVSRDRDGLIAEASDLIYHLFVLLKARGLNPEDVWTELSKRHGPNVKQ